MQQVFNLLVIVFILSLDGFLLSKHSGKGQVKSQEDALSWLNKYGYNPCLNSDVQCSLSSSSMLQEVQKRYGLQPTGKFDETTKKLMNRPRCGNHDKAIGELKTAAQLRDNKWSRTSLTYSLRGYPPQLSQTTTDRIIREAFNAWLNHIPLEIKLVCSTCPADFVLDFARGDHSDTYAFDGVGGTLAHAFFPENGGVHFDKDETWTDKYDGSDTNLYVVAVHEIGHALGLDHTYNEKSIMYPSYQLMQKSDILPQPDRDEIQRKYGRKQSSPVTTTTTRSTTTGKSVVTTKPSATPPSRDLHPRCRRFLDVAFNHPDGTLHTFDAGVLWRYLPDENSWDSQATTFQRTYPHLPKRLSAGVYDSGNREIVFFTNQNAYHYDIDSRNRVKYQKEESLSSNSQKSIMGALYYRNKIHLITSRTIRVFQTNNKYKSSDERDLNSEFPGLTGDVKTAFSYGKLHHFFTADRLVHVWNERSSSWQTLAKPMETNWFACSGSGTHGSKQTVRTSKHRNSHRHDHY